MQISDKTKDTLTGNNKAKGALCMAFDKHMKTIEDWIDNKNIMLTTPTAVECIKANTDLDENEILETEKVSA